MKCLRKDLGEKLILRLKLQNEFRNDKMIINRNILSILFITSFSSIYFIIIPALVVISCIYVVFLPVHIIIKIICLLFAFSTIYWDIDTIRTVYNYYKKPPKFHSLFQWIIRVDERHNYLAFNKCETILNFIRRKLSKDLYLIWVIDAVSTWKSQKCDGCNLNR